MKPTRRTMNQTLELTLTGKIEASNAATTSRMRKYRNKLYLDPVKHELVKAKDRIQKVEETQRIKATESKAEKQRKREKETLKKRIQRQKKRDLVRECIGQQPIEMLQNSVGEEQRKNKKIYRKMSRSTQKLKKSNEVLKVRIRSLTSKLSKFHSTPYSSDTGYDASSSDVSIDNHTPKQRTPISRHIWDVLSPNTKRKTHRSLCIVRPEGLSGQIRKEIGLNINRQELPKCEIKSLLCQKIEEFFNRPDVTKICPDKKKVAVDPINRNVKVQIRYRMGYLKDCCLKSLMQSPI